MYNAKNDANRDRKGSISHVLGDKKYFGYDGENLFNKANGYYGNVHINIFKKSDG